MTDFTSWKQQSITYPHSLTLLPAICDTEETYKTAHTIPLRHDFYKQATAKEKIVNKKIESTNKGLTTTKVIKKQPAIRKNLPERIKNHSSKNCDSKTHHINTQPATQPTVKNNKKKTDISNAKLVMIIFITLVILGIGWILFTQINNIEKKTNKEPTLEETVQDNPVEEDIRKKDKKKINSSPIEKGIVTDQVIREEIIKEEPIIEEIKKETLVKEEPIKEKIIKKETVKQNVVEENTSKETSSTIDPTTPEKKPEGYTKPSRNIEICPPRDLSCQSRVAPSKDY